MAEQEEPLYDFPEPSQTSQFKGHQRSRGSLRSISVLDRLLLTVPVWLQLSINPATALHILQREPPGTFLVRNSRTSQRKVLCVRLTDNSEPSFVQQFDIQEEHSTFSLVSSAVNFPDLPRLISFYCGSRDVLPFPLELPEAIARAVSHKELESISHMGIEFWNSHLNVRGPREVPKPQKDNVRNPDTAQTALPPPAPQQAPEVQAGQSDPDSQPTAPPDAQPSKGDPSTALFKEFCPIKTRSPKELNYGSGIGALCFINPLFLQSLNAWSRRRMFKRSLKVRVSTESSTLLSPPLVPPPPPPLMPKCKSRCKAKTRKAAEPCEDNANFFQDDKQYTQQMNPIAEEDYTELPPRTSKDINKALADVSPLPTVMESLVEDANYMQPSNLACSSHPLSPYLSPKLQPKKSIYFSPRNSPGVSPSVSPYQSPSPSPKALSPLLPFTPTTPVAEGAYDIPVSYLKTEPEAEEAVDREPESEEDVLQKELVQQMHAASLNDKDSGSLSSQEKAQELHSTVQENSASS